LPSLRRCVTIVLFIDPSVDQSPPSPSPQAGEERGVALKLCDKL